LRVLMDTRACQEATRKLILAPAQFAFSVRPEQQIAQSASLPILALTRFDMTSVSGLHTVPHSKAVRARQRPWPKRACTLKIHYDMSPAKGTNKSLDACIKGLPLRISALISSDVSMEFLKHGCEERRLFKEMGEVSLISPRVD